MQNAEVLNEKEVREAIAEKYRVSVDEVMRMKYSYIIVRREKQDNVHN